MVCMCVEWEEWRWRGRPEGVSMYQFIIVFRHNILLPCNDRWICLEQLDEVVDGDLQQRRKKRQIYMEREREVTEELHV